MLISDSDVGFINHCRMAAAEAIPHGTGRDEYPNAIRTRLLRVVGSLFVFALNTVKGDAA
ncbi:hypothetical protein BFP49_06785 [Bacillus licheniformis]|nr:hypothetical protein BFP49_06785 [Bacillus licheniformis]